MLLAVALTLATASPALAFNLNDYFTYSYSISLSTNEVWRDETFAATVSGQATCKKSLPVSPSAVSVTGRMVARHGPTGTRVVLNPGYTLELLSFPSKPGETVQASATVPLVFPPGSPSGSYTLVGEVVEARAKILWAWVSVKQYVPSSREAGTVEYHGEDEPPPGSPERVTDAGGRFPEDTTVRTEDNRLRLHIRAGTTGRTATGRPLAILRLTRLADPPPAPAATSRVGPVYELGPDGATFDTPLQLIIAYNEAELPPGADESRLYIAAWDRAAARWQPLESVVDTEANTVSARVTHFTPYGLLVPSAPAELRITGLALAPDTVSPGETAVVEVTIENTGDLAGSRDVTVLVDGHSHAGQEVTLPGGTTATLLFNLVRDRPGTYQVSAGRLTVTLTVTAAPPDRPAPAGTARFELGDLRLTPAVAGPGEEVTVSLVVTNRGSAAGRQHLVLRVSGVVEDSRDIPLEAGTSRVVQFTVSREIPGTYQVEVGELTGSFTVTAPEGPARPVGRAWWWVGGAVLGLCLGAGVVLLITRRRRR